MKGSLSALCLMAVTAAVCFSVSATTGFASSRGSTRSAYDVYPRDVAAFVGMDWQCGFLLRNGGRIISCGRESTIRGIGVTVTGGWVRVWKYGTSSKTLLLERQRNP
jgi:hypothetical protein